MAKATYEELLAEVSITLTPNDAAFLAIILNQWLEDSRLTPTAHMQQLVAKLSGKAGC